jgi:hypothetical protein
LPGIKVHLLEEPKGTEYDMHFIENLYISSAERRTLENLQKGRTREGSSKCLPRTSIEDYLERILQVNGEKGLNSFRDKAREVVGCLGMEAEFETLNTIISALLSTKLSKVLTSAAALARAHGEPYDANRIKLFDILFDALHN